MVTKRIVIGMINVLEMGTLQIRHDTIIEDDGVEIARTYHREVLEPGDDIEDKEERIQAIAKALWTSEVINARRAELTKIRERFDITRTPNIDR